MILSFDEFILYENDTTGGDPEVPWFIILLGGSGTGKGALVSTSKALGEIGDYIEGKSFSTETLKKKVEQGNKHIRSVFEPDRILRLAQHTAGVADYKKIISADAKKSLKETLQGVLGEHLTDLKSYVIKKCGGDKSTVQNFIDTFPANEEDPEGAKYSNAYIGKKYKPADVEEEIEAVDIMDALGDTERAEGDKNVMYQYQQMRKRSTESSNGEPLKEYAVKQADELISKHIGDFKKVFGEAKIERTEGGKSGAIIIDSAGEDLARQPVKMQLAAAKAGGFNTMIVLLCSGPVQSFIGNAERKIARAARGVPAEEIMSFYNTLPEKHKEFREYGRRDDELGYQLLDSYKILDQDQITPRKLLDVLDSLCIGDSQHGPVSKDKVICTDPSGDCIDKDLYPGYLTKELRNIVKRVNKNTRDLKQSKKEAPARDWTDIFPEEERKKELGVVHGKIKQARALSSGDKPLDIIDGFSKDAENMFIDWKQVVSVNKKAEMKTPATSENRILDFKSYVMLTEGFGHEPFFLSKNGDDYSYFFKVEGKTKRGFVLSVNKSAVVAKPSEKSDEYAVLHLTEISEDALEQAVMQNGKYQKNNDAITVNDSDLVNVFANVAQCVSDYLDQNAGVTKFYDEMPLTLRAQRYEDKMEVSFDKWPGEWKMQEQEPGKLWIYSK